MAIASPGAGTSPQKRGRYLFPALLAGGGAALTGLAARDLGVLRSWRELYAFGLGILLVSFLATAVIWLLYSSRQRMVALAAQGTEELVRNEARFRFIFENVPVGLSWFRVGHQHESHV